MSHEDHQVIPRFGDREDLFCDVLALLAFIAASFAVSALGGLITATSVGDWYQELQKPAFNPPNWLFAPVWTVLYLMIAVAGWRVWRRIGWGGGLALPAFAAQLALNLGWSSVFFGLKSPGAALAVILALMAAILVTTRLFWAADRLAGLLFLPYLAWVGFATVLNAAIWHLN